MESLSAICSKLITAHCIILYHKCSKAWKYSTLDTVRLTYSCGKNNTFFTVRDLNLKGIIIAFERLQKHSLKCICSSFLKTIFENCFRFFCFFKQRKHYFWLKSSDFKILKMKPRSISGVTDFECLEFMLNKFCFSKLI